MDALADPAVVRRLAELGQEIVPRDQQAPEALGAYQKVETGIDKQLMAATGELRRQAAA